MSFLEYSSLILIVLILVGCAETKVISIENGLIVVHGPVPAKNYWYLINQSAQNVSDKSCVDLGMEKATYIGGKRHGFGEGLHNFHCVIPTEKILGMKKIISSLDEIGGCIHSNISNLDDLRSDAKTIAEGEIAVFGSLMYQLHPRFNFP